MASATGGSTGKAARFEALVEVGSEIQSALDKVNNTLGWANRGAQLYSGVQAFRKYNWLTNLPGRNSVGNFRGMVIDKDAKMLFDITSKNAELLKLAGDALLLAALALEIAKSVDRAKQILASNDDPAVKGERLSVMTSAVIFRTLGAPIVPGVHLVTRSLVLACGLTNDPKACATTLQGVDAFVNSKYQQITNDDNIVHYIDSQLVFF